MEKGNCANRIGINEKTVVLTTEITVFNILTKPVRKL